MTINLRFIINGIYFFIIVLLLLSSWMSAILFILFVSLWNHFYKIRKINSITLFSPQNISSSRITSPVYGKVQEVVELNQRKYLKIRVGFFDHKGLYAMDNSVVDHVDRFDNAKTLGIRRSIKRLILRTKYRQIQFSFYSDRRHCSLSVIKSPFFLSASTMLMPGDRVSQGAHIGWLPLGGIVLVDLPIEGKLLVKPGDKIKIFRTEIMELKI